MKPELSEEDVRRIIAALDQPDVPEHMRVAFHISLHTGLRYAETRIKLTEIDFTRAEIHIPEPKGGARRAFSIPMPEALREMFEGMRREKCTHTWTVSKRKGAVPRGIAWRRFFDGLGLHEVSFHSCRITFVTRCARAGVPQSVSQRLVNHASATVHRIYQRVSAADLRAWSDKIARGNP